MQEFLMLLRFLLPVLFTSGSMRAYTFADFVAIANTPFEFFSNYIISICADKGNTKSIFYKLFILQNLPVD